VKRTGAYLEIVAEIVDGRDSMGRAKRQVRPISGQGLDPSLNIECARKLREDHPIGTRFRLRVQLTDMNGTSFLYSYFGWPVEVLR
jgi:hypothetical protein